MTQRIGILGGSFDPIHRGHLHLARAACRRLGLDRVLFVPAAQQPLKPGPRASDVDRRRMIELALASPQAADLPAELCPIELERGGPSYTVDTLEQLRERLGADAQLFFLAGADVLRDLPRWRALDRVLELARFVVATRPGYRPELPAALRGRIRWLEIEPFAASSSEIRAALARGELARVRPLLVPAVFDFIRERGLYGLDLASAGTGLSHSASTSTIAVVHPHAPATTAAGGTTVQPETGDRAPVTSTIERLGEHVGERVRIRGWVHKLRSKGKLHFLVVRDGTGFVQAVAFRKELDPEVFERVGRLAHEAAIEVTGTVRTDERAPGGVELGLEGCTLVHSPVEEFPIGRKEHGPDFLLRHRHLWLRSEKQWAILRVRHEVEHAICEFFYERGFTRFDAPILTPAACEGTTTLFELEYFDEGKAYLTQSGQLYAEAGAMALGKVFTFGPTFRAEKSKTRRHLTEFWMVEPEVAFARLDDVMDLAEALVCRIVERVLERRGRELALLGRDRSRLEAVRAPFPRIRYDEAVQILREAGHDFRWGEDFGAPEETTLSQHFERPVLVHRYPHEVKAFYMKRDPEDERLALCVDMIAPEGVGEIIGGSEREDDLATLEARVREHGLPLEAFEWYLDLRRFGSVPHGGFGLGLERTVAWLCGREHVRECIPFPRMLHRIEP